MFQFKSVLGMFLGGILLISSLQATASPEPAQRKYHKLVYTNLRLAVKNYDLIIGQMDGFITLVAGKEGHDPEKRQRLVTEGAVGVNLYAFLDKITIANRMLTAIEITHEKNDEKLTDADYRDIVSAHNYFSKVHETITSQIGLIEHKVLDFRDVSMGEEALVLIRQGRQILVETYNRALLYTD